MRYFLSFILLTLNLIANSQHLSGTELLKKAIAYHDPLSRWSQFSGKLYIDMEMPNESVRHSIVSLSNKENFFRLEVYKGNTSTNQKWENDECTFALNGSNDITDAQEKEHGLTCERTLMYKNYYSYLYGLPMKLMDDGTIIDKEVERVTFHNKNYYKLRVTYKAEVGSDVWYFYFNTTTYGLEAYQFYHDEAKNDGEYILLNDIEDVNGMKIPKIRTWYFNKNDELLGTDKLIKAEDL